MDEQIVSELMKKLNPSVDRLKEGKADDYDIFPALLWTLLEYELNFDKRLTKIQERFDLTTKKLHELIESAKLSSEVINQNSEELFTNQVTQLQENSQTTIEEFKVFINQVKEKLDNSDNRINKKLKWLLVFSAFQFLSIIALFFIFLIIKGYLSL